jgi:hypothetical protein
VGQDLGDELSGESTRGTSRIMRERLTMARAL